MDISPEQFDCTYKIGKFLGEGAFGTVYQAQNVKDDLEYAVKRIHLPHGQEVRKHIMREKENMRKMNHQNVIKCFNFTIKNDGLEGKH